MSPRRLVVHVRRWYRALVGGDVLEVVPLLSLLVLVLSAFEEWYMLGPFVMLCVAGCAHRPWRESPVFWYLAAMLFGLAIYLNWANADNHKYLMGYWCLALCAVHTLRPDQRAEAMALNARLLVGLCMLLAVFWRSSSDCYLDGAFFRFELLTDERFAYFARWAGDATADMLADNRQLKDLLVSGHLRGLALDEVRLAASPGLVWWGNFLTWWTIGLEGAIAAAFLAPDGQWSAWTRNPLLLLFGLTTYSVAPVRGFGWMLMLLGWAQCGERDQHFRGAYLAAMLLVQAYTIPYGPLLDGLGALLAG